MHFLPNFIFDCIKATRVLHCLWIVNKAYYQGSSSLEYLIDRGEKKINMLISSKWKIIAVKAIISRPVYGKRPDTHFVLKARKSLLFS